MTRNKDIHAFDVGKRYGQCEVIGRDGSTIHLLCHACGKKFSRACANVKKCNSCGCLNYAPRAEAIFPQPYKPDSITERALARIGTQIGPFTLESFEGFAHNRLPLYRYTAKRGARIATLRSIQTIAKHYEKRNRHA